jgi:hypothetical protein
MKNFKQIIITVLVFLLSQTISFAQTPTDFGDAQDANNLDAPIDSNLWVLLVVGLLYVFYKYWKGKQIFISPI